MFHGMHSFDTNLPTKCVRLLQFANGLQVPMRQQLPDEVCKSNLCDPLPNNLYLPPLRGKKSIGPEVNVVRGTEKYSLFSEYGVRSMKKYRVFRSAGYGKVQVIFGVRATEYVKVQGFSEYGKRKTELHVLLNDSKVYFRKF